MELEVYESRPQLSDSLIYRIIQTATESQRIYGNFLVCLSGGSLLDILCDQLTQTSVDYSQWYFFMVDERIVNLNDKESNVGEFMRKISSMDIPKDHILNVEYSEDHILFATNYELAIREFYSRLNRPHHCWPILDLVILGLGEDGHTASLFPGDPWFDKDKDRIVKETLRRPVSPAKKYFDKDNNLDNRKVSETDHELLKWTMLITNSPKPPVNRITFTLPVILKSSSMVFVAMGYGKSPIMSVIYNSYLGPCFWNDEEWREALKPATFIGLIRKEQGNPCVWMLDKDAAHDMEQGTNYENTN